MTGVAAAQLGSRLNVRKAAGWRHLWQAGHENSFQRHGILKMLVACVENQALSEK